MSEDPYLSPVTDSLSKEQKEQHAFKPFPALLFTLFYSSISGFFSFLCSILVWGVSNKPFLGLATFSISLLWVSYQLGGALSKVFTGNTYAQAAARWPKKLGYTALISITAIGETLVLLVCSAALFRG